MSTDQEILQELRSLNQNLTRNSPFAAQNPMNGTQMATQLSNVTQGVVSTAGSMINGSMDMTKAMKTVTSVLGIFPDLGPALSGIITATSNELLNMNNSMIMAGRNGVTFSQNLFLYTKMLGDAGISFESFNKILANNSKQMMGFGLNAMDSAKNFLEATTAIRNAPDVLNARLMGIDFEEFQSQLLTGADLMKFADGKRADVTEKLVLSTIQATEAIDDYARITGRSRQEIQKDVDKAAQSRLLEVAKMSMSKEELEAMQKSLPFMTQFGDGVANIFQEMSVFGDVVTKEGREAIAGLNTAFPGLAEKMREMTQTLDPARRKELELEIQYMMGERLSNKESMRELNILATRKEAWAVQLVEAITKSQSLGAGARARFEEAGGDRAKFEELTTASTRLREAIAEALGKPGQPGGPGAALSQILRGFDVAIQGGNTAVANYIQKFQQELGEGISQAMPDPQKILEKILSLQRTTDPDRLQAIATSMTGYTGVNTDVTTGTNVPNDPRYRRGQTTQDPLYVNIVNGRDLGAPRDDGSFGAKNGSGSGLDRWMENFGDGTLIQAHREEGMVTRKQAVPFALDALGETGILNNLVGGLMSSVNSQMDPSIVREMISSVEKIPGQIKFPELGTTAADIEDKKILAEMLERLNTKMERLIAVVQDGSKGTVKAVKSQNNLIG